MTMTMGRSVLAAIEELAGRVDVAARLATLAGTAPARGADALATVAAYRLAAIAADDEVAHATKVDALRAFVATTDAAHRPFRAELIEAALVAELDARIARGAPFLGRRLRGWLDGAWPNHPTPRTGRSEAAGADASVPQSVVEACAEAANLDDVDAVLLRTLSITRSMRSAAERGEPRGALLDRYQNLAFALCVRPPLPGAIDDARFLILHQWTLLRRRRPLAAAVVRRRVGWMRGRVRDD